MAATSVAESLLSSIVSNALQGAATRQAFASLLLPPSLSDPSATLPARDLVSLLYGTRSNLLGLSSSAERLDSANPLSAFYTATVASSDSGAVTGDVVAGISSETTPEKATYTFTVSQLAVAQANVGSALDSDTTSSFTTGTNTLRITQAGTTTDVSFTVGAGDSNETVLTTLASAINDTDGIGVSASVLTDAAAGTSRLVVTSTTTGTTHAFTLSDVTNTAVADAGVTNATTAAQNAAYTQNGTALTRDTNDFYLGTYANLHVQFQSTTSSSVTLTVGTDTSQIAGAVTSLVQDFNSARSFFASAGDAYAGLTDQLDRASFRLRGTLHNIGIDLTNDGSLSVDADRLDTALTQNLGGVQAALGDAGGFARNVHLLADQTLATPTAATSPLPPFQAGYAPQQLLGAFATRLQSLQQRGLLVNALI
jgi:flagellar hook-associated protein 2